MDDYFTAIIIALVSLVIFIIYTRYTPKIVKQNPSLIYEACKLKATEIYNGAININSKPSWTLDKTPDYYTLTLYEKDKSSSKKLIIPIDPNWDYHSLQYKLIVDGVEYDNLPGQKHLIKPPDIRKPYLTIKNTISDKVTNINGNTREDIVSKIRDFIDNDD